MPRVALNPELRVPTALPSVLGDLPTALGGSDKPKQTVSVTRTTSEVREAITRSYRRREGEIGDEGISGIAYEPAKHAGGRPTDYTKKFPRIVFEFALLGLTDERIAAAMQIDVTTFYVWCKEKPEFSQALVDGRENADRIVANAMYKRATGFKYEAVKIFHNKDDGTVYAPYEEYVPPDVNAGKYWLGIRRGKLRKDGWDIDTDGNLIAPPGTTVIINMSDPQEAAKQYREIMQLEHVP